MTMLRHDMPDNSPSVDQTIIDLPLEVKAGGLPGEFEGYGAVFGNTDRDGDVVERGAFADSLKERLPALLWQHNPREPIGRFDVVREDERGLFVKGRLAQSGRGAEAYELLKMGALNGLSIGFVTKEAMRNSAAGTRTIKRAELMEVSLVTFPANELARVQTVKQRNVAPLADHIETPQSFEAMLCDNGFSRMRAKAITAKGFKSLSSETPINQVAALVETVKSKQLALEQKRTSKSVSLYEGQTSTVGLLYDILDEWAIVEIRPRDKDVSFEARVYYHFWTENGPLPRDTILYGDGARGRFRERFKIRNKKAGLGEQILGGRHGAPVKIMKIEVKALRGSTIFDIGVK